MGRERADLHGLGTFIRERRQEMGLTQAELGRRIGYYQERISALERGTYGTPSLPALMELAGALECDLPDLLRACGYLHAQAQEPAGDMTLVTESRLRAEMEKLEERLEAAEAIIEEVREQVQSVRPLDASLS